MLYIVVALVAVFFASGVLTRWLEWRARLCRVREFERRYRDWVEDAGDVPDEWDLIGTVVTSEQTVAIGTTEKSRAWLVARRNEMQRDARSVGKGVMYVAPPPMIGGSFKPHPYFLDLFDEQTDSIGSTRVRLDDLVTIIHEVEAQVGYRRHDLFNPAAWLRLTFTRLVRFPAWVLRTAGFSEQTASNAAVKAMGAAWSLLVGAAGIAGFVWSVTHAA